MDWTRILKEAGIAEAPGHAEAAEAAGAAKAARLESLKMAQEEKDKARSRRVQGRKKA